MKYLRLRLHKNQRKILAASHLSKMMVIITLFFISIPQKSYSQIDTATVTRYILISGIEIEGTKLYEDEDKVVLKTSYGAEVSLQKNLIATSEEKKILVHKGKFVKNDPNKTRLFFVPTARTLNKGDGYFAAYEIFFPFLTYGITDYLTISGGLSLLPGNPLENQIKYFASKIRITNDEQLTLSAGFFWLSVSNISSSLIYGIASYGDYPFSISTGLGFGYSQENFTEKPFAMLGMEFQVSNNVKFLSENWVFPEVDGAVISLGIRFFGENLAADFGFFTHTEILDEGAFPFIPWIGFAYNF